MLATTEKELDALRKLSQPSAARLQHVQQAQGPQQVPAEEEDHSIFENLSDINVTEGSFYDFLSLFNVSASINSCA